MTERGGKEVKRGSVFRDYDWEERQEEVGSEVRRKVQQFLVSLTSLPSCGLCCYCGAITLLYNYRFFLFFTNVPSSLRVLRLLLVYFPANYFICSFPKLNY